jgi:putative spermidine/putrescine transport system substrate-binding protein
MPEKNNLQVSRRSFLRTAGAAVPALGLAPGLLGACGTSDGAATADRLVVAGGGGKLTEAYREAYYKPFTAKTGIKIVEATNDVAKLKSMVQFGNVEWDVVQMDPVPAAAAGVAKILEPLDYSVISRAGLAPDRVEEYYLPCDYAALTIGWNTKSMPPGSKPDSWAALLDLKKYPGQRGLQKVPFQTLEVALLADGTPPDKLYPIDVERALGILDRIKDKITWWTSGAQSATLLTSGQVALSTAWNGRLEGPKQQQAPIDFTLDTSMLVADAWAVPRGVKNKKLSMQFIAFCMQPENQARLPKYVPYRPANEEAKKTVGEAAWAKLPGADGLGNTLDFGWWATNQERVLKRWNDWIIA